MRNALFAAAIVCVAGAAASAQVDEAAKARLEKVAETVKGLRSLSYSVVNKGGGGFFDMIPEHRAQVTMLKDPATNLWNMRITGTRAPAMNEPSLDFIVVHKGNNRLWIDDQAKTVHERPQWNATGVPHLAAATQAAPRELTLADPFARELQASTITFEAPTVIEGVPVEVILVDPGENQPKYRYFVAADHFPRRIEQDLGEMMGKTGWTLSAVAVNPPIADHAFKIDVPDGYAFQSTVPAQAPQAQPGNPPTTSPVRLQRQVGTEIDDLAPDFTLKNPEGEDVTLSTLRGNVVLLDFWGTWCIPCKKASPGLQAISEKFKDDPFKLYGLAVRERNDEHPINYMKENNYTYGLLLKADEVARTYRVRVYPSYFVIGKAGEITFIASGFEDNKTIPDLEEAIEIALGKRAPKPKPAPVPAPAPAAPTPPKPADPDSAAPRANPDATSDTAQPPQRNPRSAAPRPAPGERPR
jgi:thiol-disulfide isomerase/thioredoxin